jgi:hypothetical protein
VAADNHVLVLRLRRSSLGSALTRYLNGQDAYRLRQVLTTGTTLPSISALDMGRIPVPASVLEQPNALAVQLPLAQRLEQILWQR